VFSGLNNTTNAAEDWLPHGRVCGKRKAVQQILVHTSDMPALIRYGMMDYNVARGCHSSTTIHHISDKKKNRPVATSRSMSQTYHLKSFIKINHMRPSSTSELLYILWYKVVTPAMNLSV
jgi:hypothetical protein